MKLQHDINFNSLNTLLTTFYDGRTLTIIPVLHSPSES
jgi:hypothetical protein